MSYKVLESARTQKEIDHAIDYYSARSENAPKDFISAIKSAYDTLTINPFFEVRYKEVRSLKLNRFP